MMGFKKEKGKPTLNSIYVWSSTTLRLTLVAFATCILNIKTDVRLSEVEAIEKLKIN